MRAVLIFPVHPGVPSGRPHTTDSWPAKSSYSWLIRCSRLHARRASTGPQAGLLGEDLQRERDPSADADRISSVLTNARANGMSALGTEEPIDVTQGVVGLLGCS